MPRSPSAFHWQLPRVLTLLLLGVGIAPLAAQDSSRMTPLVKAIAKARPAVVNIRGSKSLAQESARDGMQTKQVNGMGTGVVIDSRGYILTNYHVVEDVSQIRISTSQRETVLGEVIAHDRGTDLALLKIRTAEELPTIPLGGSHMILLAESVAAIGNAYGYEHTVTEGIVSELGRTVQVSDDQIYYDLIQTDASINPGNSGGPLLNLDGDMIGINVAVRVGAQGIAFAIPVNDALEVAANLMKQLVNQRVHNGLSVETKYDGDRCDAVVVGVEPGSVAADAGLQVGDKILAVGDVRCQRALDVYRAMIELQPNDQVCFEFQRGEEPSEVTCVLRPSPVANANPRGTDLASLAWSVLGVEVAELNKDSMRRINGNYEGGLRIVQVRPNSPAEQGNLRAGDVLVALHEWKTESADNLQYILQQSELSANRPCDFFIFRNNQPLRGTLRLSRHTSTAQAK